MNDQNYNKYLYEQLFNKRHVLLSNIVMWGALAILALLIILPIFLHFYKGKTRTVQIVKLRKTVRDMFQPANTFQRNSYAEFVHYTVDVKYMDGKHIHTFNCSEELYGELEEGKTYTVVIRFTDLMKIYKTGNDNIDP